MELHQIASVLAADPASRNAAMVAGVPILAAVHAAGTAEKRHSIRIQVVTSRVVEHGAVQAIDCQAESAHCFQAPGLNHARKIVPAIYDRTLAHPVRPCLPPSPRDAPRPKAKPSRARRVLATFATTRRDPPVSRLDEPLVAPRSFGCRSTGHSGWQVRLTRICSDGLIYMGPQMSGCIMAILFVSA
jgi:hypothetical protein